MTSVLDIKPTRPLHRQLNATTKLSVLNRGYRRAVLTEPEQNE
jgi:hypothetical protein